jgi:CRISPR-associated protein Cas1
MRVRDTSQIVIFGRAQVSTMALREAMDLDIPVMYFTYGGYFSGMATGHGHKNFVPREQQFRAAVDLGRH